MFRTFSELIEAAKRHPAARTLAVAAAEDADVIAAALRAYGEGVAEPVFIGRADEIKRLLDEQGADPARFRIEDAAAAGDCALKAVRLVAAGEANVLMKGLLETRDFLRPVVRRENGLAAGGIMSHVMLFKIPNYHKLIALSDGGMVPYPTLSEKAAIITNAVAALSAIGCTEPKVALLCAIEKVNEKLRETVEAAQLADMNARGEISGCAVIGPISYDIAMSAEIARHKGYACAYCGDFDALIVPDLVSGNVLGKCLTLSAGASLAGIVVGAKAPIVLPSRGSSAEEKFQSIAFAALAAAGGSAQPA